MRVLRSRQKKFNMSAIESVECIYRRAIERINR
jgi:hypothetical protein